MISCQALILTALPAICILAGRADELQPKQIKAALKLYNVKCAKCHKFYDPARYASNEWQQWMDKMSRKAKLKPEQDKLLSAYLSRFRDPTGAATNGIPRPR